MKTVKVHTTTTVISEGGKVKPTAPIWSFINTGLSKIIINNNFPLLPGASFGVSIDGAVAPFLLAGIEVSSDTQFEVQFIDTSKVDFLSGNDKGIGHLVETFLTYN